MPQNLSNAICKQALCIDLMEEIQPRRREPAIHAGIAPDAGETQSDDLAVSFIVLAPDLEAMAPRELPRIAPKRNLEEAARLRPREALGPREQRLPLARGRRRRVQHEEVPEDQRPQAGRVAGR